VTGSRETGTELNGRNPGELFAKPDVRVTRRADGTMVLSAAEPLDRYGRSMNEHLVDWAHRAPQRPFLLERDAQGAWHGVTYGRALGDVQRIAAGLLERRSSADRPVAILSDNGVEHALRPDSRVGARRRKEQDCRQ